MRTARLLALLAVGALLSGCGTADEGAVGSTACATSASVVKVEGGWEQRLGPVSIGGFDEDGVASVKPTIDGKLYVSMPVRLRVPGSSQVTMKATSSETTRTARLTHSAPGNSWEDAEGSAEFTLTGDPAQVITPSLPGYLVLNEPGCVTVSVLVNGTNYGPIAAIVKATGGTQPVPAPPAP